MRGKTKREQKIIMDCLKHWYKRKSPIKLMENSQGSRFVEKHDWHGTWWWWQRHGSCLLSLFLSFSLEQTDFLAELDGLFDIRLYFTINIQLIVTATTLPKKARRLDDIGYFKWKAPVWSFSLGSTLKKCTMIPLPCPPGCYHIVFTLGSPALLPEEGASNYQTLGSVLC